MEKEPAILAVDLGTSALKTALITISGRVLGWEICDIPLHILPDGGAEQDPEDWWQAFLYTAHHIIQKRIVPQENIVAVCCSTQGECTIPVDDRGNALMNVISWLDMRGAKHLPELIGGPVKVAGYNAFKLPRWMSLTGGVPTHTGTDPASHMLLVKYDFPEVYKKTYKFLTALDYMNVRLTGQFVATPDSILTSWVTDNRDPQHIKYDDTLIKYSGIEKDKFPELVLCTSVIGDLKADVAHSIGLKAPVKVVAGAIDVSAAAIGAGATEDFDAHVYIGTSNWIATHVPYKKTDLGYFIASVPCAIPDKYLLILLQTTAGGNLNYLRDKILYHKDELLKEEKAPDVFQIFDRIAAKTPPGSHGMMYMPWIFGERAQRHGCFIVVGIASPAPSGRLLNSAYLFSPGGEVAGVGRVGEEPGSEDRRPERVEPRPERTMHGGNQVVARGKRTRLAVLHDVARQPARTTLFPIVVEDVGQLVF